MEGRGSKAKPARCPKQRSLRAAAAPRVVPFLALGASLLLLGCAGGGHRGGASPSLVAGRRAGPIPRAQLASATSLAARFGTAYGHSAYLRRPPRLPGTTRVVQRDLALAAARVPPSRRDLRPRAVKVSTAALGARLLRASVEIEDGRSPPFSVGFGLARRGSRWRVISVSPPG